MKADYTFEWYVQEIPPRCRKPRDVLHTKTVEVNIPEFRGVEVDKKRTCGHCCLQEGLRHEQKGWRRVQAL